MKITIVGAGIAGLSTAWSLTKAGHSVTLIEQGGDPHAAVGRRVARFINDGDMPLLRRWLKAEALDRQS